MSKGNDLFNAVPVDKSSKAVLLAKVIIHGKKTFLIIPNFSPNARTVLFTSNSYLTG